MAPNIKEINDALLSLDLSQHVLTSKYAPLTLTSEVAAASAADGTASEAAAAAAASPKLQQQHHVAHRQSADQVQQQQQQQQQQAGRDLDLDRDLEQESYWDMPHRPDPTEDGRRRALVEAILREEEVRQMLAADHVVANLRREAAAAAIIDKNNESAETGQDMEEAAGYWDMPGDDDVVESSLIDNEANASDDAATIPACLTTDHIVSNLVSEGQRLSNTDDDDGMVVAPHVHDPTHPHQTYWDWDTSPRATNYEAKRRVLIAQILEEEEARQITSAGHVVRTILESRRSRGALLHAVEESATTGKGRADPESESYWSFPPRTTDPSDTVVAPHAYARDADPNHPLADYWVWDTAPKSPAEQRRVLIDWILRDEAARQATSVEVVVEGLRAQAAACNANADEGRDDVVREESKESAGGYWDW
eukprot:CAMPEP_0181073390 /NCGR_PEP_ID=MMETSP1070-20121207/29054_1 /TAXON_ID=265543 /ORGANISM="Minutocellus polymorphus, Strain NH13" /LENGTH=422 /DNA_ID=CAMNT_0023154459 /DNA_START=87 /DNA_END=1355 /DNA_ORIENTATION=-